VTVRLPAGASVQAQLQLNGAGATFPYPMYSKWFNDYIKVDPSVRFNYQSIGSGGGIQSDRQETAALSKVTDSTGKALLNP